MNSINKYQRQAIRLRFNAISNYKQINYFIKKLFISLFLFEILR